MLGKIRVLLLNPPFKEPIIRDNYCCFTSKSGYLWAPADLLYLSGILNDPRIKLFVEESVAKNSSWDDVYRLVKEKKIEIIICLTGTASFRKDMGKLKKLARTGIKFYVLGNTPAFEPKRFMKEYPFVDGIFHNFFDNRILNFLLSNKKSNSITKRYKNGSIKYGEVNFLKEGLIDLIKPPQYQLFPLRKYITPISLRRPIATSILGYGCPFRCSFCIGSATSFIPRTLDSIKQEFDAMKKAGVKEIFFQDSTFNAQLQHLEDILDLMIKENYSFTWSANVHSFLLPKKTLEKMKKTGCHNLQIGAESGVQRILDRHAPSKQKKNISRLVADCKQVGIKTLAYFIIGLPGENAKDAKKTIDYAIELNSDFTSFSVVTPDYGTKLYAESVENQLFDDTDELKVFDSSDRAVLKIPGFSKEEQDRMIRSAYIRFYLRPSKIFQYLTDFSGLINYGKNAWFLMFKKIL